MIKYEPTRTRPKQSSQTEREVLRNTNLRQASTCYGHLVGVTGIALMQELRRLKWFEESATFVSGNRVGYGLTAEGRLAMNDMGVDLAAADKSTGHFAFGCLDWTKRGHHLGGSLGRVLTASVAERGLVSRTSGFREVTLQGSPCAWFRQTWVGRLSISPLEYSCPSPTFNINLLLGCVGEPDLVWSKNLMVDQLTDSQRKWYDLAAKRAFGLPHDVELRFT